MRARQVILVGREKHFEEFPVFRVFHENMFALQLLKMPAALGLSGTSPVLQSQACTSAKEVKSSSFYLQLVMRWYLLITC